MNYSHKSTTSLLKYGEHLSWPRLVLNDCWNENIKKISKIYQQLHLLSVTMVQTVRKSIILKSCRNDTLYLFPHFRQWTHNKACLINKMFSIQTNVLYEKWKFWKCVRWLNNATAHRDVAIIRLFIFVKSGTCEDGQNYRWGNMVKDRGLVHA